MQSDCSCSGVGHTYCLNGFIFTYKLLLERYEDFSVQFVIVIIGVSDEHPFIELIKRQFWGVFQ